MEFKQHAAATTGKNPSALTFISGGFSHRMASPVLANGRLASPLAVKRISVGGGNNF
jgi:hypothetical protein